MNRGKNYTKLFGYMKRMDKVNYMACQLYLAENKELLKHARGSLANHQAWEGGYLDHILMTMEIAEDIYPALSKKYNFEFGLDDVFVCLFLHDIEKPAKYEKKGDNLEMKIEMRDKEYVQKFRLGIIDDYRFKLTSDQYNAIDFAEGEIGKWDPKKRSMTPLAAFVHMCDVASA